MTTKKTPLDQIQDAINMNAAIYEMLFAAAEGDVTSDDLANAINKAIELNAQARQSLQDNWGVLSKALEAAEKHA